MSGKVISAASAASGVELAPTATAPVAVAVVSVLENPVPNTSTKSFGKFFKSCCSCIWGATSGIRETLVGAAKEAVSGVLEDEVKDRLGDKLSESQLRIITNVGKKAVTGIIDTTAKKLDHLAETHGSAEHIKSGEAISGLVTSGAMLIPGADKIAEIAKPSLKKPIITHKVFKDLATKMKDNGGKIDLSLLSEVEVLSYKQITDSVIASIDANPDITPKQKATLKKTGAMSVLVMEFINEQNKIIAAKTISDISDHGVATVAVKAASAASAAAGLADDLDHGVVAAVAIDVAVAGADSVLSDVAH
jgi:hypothetical protein